MTIYGDASNLNAKVSSVLLKKIWIWKPAQSIDLVPIQSKA